MIFFSTNPTFTVTKNGVYLSTTTLQEEVSGTWTDMFTTELSYAYGTIDQSPFESYRDLAEIARITELNNRL